MIKIVYDFNISIDYEKFGIDPNQKHCPTCQKLLTSPWQIQLHHKFSQKEVNLAIYGDLLHACENLQVTCWNCHPSHSHPNLIFWTEVQFCDALKIEPRSKVFKLKNLLKNNKS